MNPRGLLACAAFCSILAAAVAHAQDQTGGAALPVERPAPGKRAAEAAKHEVVVLVLHATNAGTGIDKRIADMDELKKPPFSSYDSYTLLDTKRAVLARGVPRSIRLPNRRILQAELLEILRGKAVRLSARINQPGGKTFLPLLEVKAKLGQPFIVAGQRYRQGILVLVVRVNEVQPAAPKSKRKKSSRGRRGRQSD
jgi:hypothetical protein